MRVLPPSRVSLGLVALMACATGCSEEEAPVPEVVVLPLCPTTPRTCKQVQAYSWADGITVECAPGDEFFLVKSTGVPPYLKATAKLQAQDWEFLVPLSPACDTAPAPLGPASQPHGLLLNGVPFFPALDPKGNDLVLSQEHADECEGSLGVGCAYGYRTVSPCVFGKGEDVAAHADKDGHGALVGLALDGFGLHAPETSDGEPAVDACGGHMTEARGYHYHGSASAPYTLGCMVGATQGDIRYTARLPKECLGPSGPPKM